MQFKPMKETDPRDVFAIESLLHAHAEKAPPLAHDPAATSPAPPVHVAPPVSVGAPIPHVEPPPFDPALRASDARDASVENVRSREIKVDGLKPPGAQPTSRWMKRVVMAVLALFGATAAAGWHQYGDQARAMAAEWAPPFVLAALPSATRPAAAEHQPGAPVAEANTSDPAAAQQPVAAAATDQPAPAAIAATPPAAEANQLQSMAQDLAAMGQQVEELKATIAQLKASQAQMARELAKASEAKAAEVKAADTRPAEPNLRPKVSTLSPPPAHRPAPPPVRKPKPVASTYSPAYAPAPVAAAPPPPPQAAAPLPPAPPAQTIADDGQPVVRPPMPLR
jgi:hypothetical protein